MILSLDGVGCHCVHKCPNSGDPGMEPFIDALLGEGNELLDLLLLQLSNERVGSPPYSSKSQHVLWCLVSNRYSASQMNGLIKAQISGEGGSISTDLTPQGPDHTTAYTEAHRATMNLPQPSPSSYICIEFVFSDTFCSHTKNLL